jgi:hypothetical protein
VKAQVRLKQNDSGDRSEARNDERSRRRRRRRRRRTEEGDVRDDSGDSSE